MNQTTPFCLSHAKALSGPGLDGSKVMGSPALASWGGPGHPWEGSRVPEEEAGSGGEGWRLHSAVLGPDEEPQRAQDGCGSVAPQPGV